MSSRRWCLLASVLLTVVLAACTSGGSDGSTSSTTAPSSSPSSPGSSASPQPTPSVRRTITVAGRARTYLVHRPAGLPAHAALVLVLHGGGGSAAAAERSFGWDATADREHFVVAYPQGIGRSWNDGGGCCGPSARAHVDDVTFLEHVVSDVGRNVALDAHRVYAAGISLGGMMTYRLACDSTVFAAIGPDSATLLGSCPHPAPVSVLHIHGTADTRIPYDGSAGSGGQHIDGPSVPALNAMWRRVDHCAAPSTSRRGTVTASSAVCPAGRAVELITIAGAGHQWPGARCNARCSDGSADAPSRALDATTTMWRFFAAHPK